MMLAAAIVVAATSVVIIVSRTVQNLEDKGARGWRRLTATQHIATANQLRDRIAVLVSKAISNNLEAAASTVSPPQREEIQSLARQAQLALEAGRAALNPTDQDHFAATLAEIQPTIDTFFTTSEDLLGLVLTNQRAKAQTALPRLTESSAQFGTGLARIIHERREDGRKRYKITRYELRI